MNSVVNCSVAALILSVTSQGGSVPPALSSVEAPPASWGATPSDTAQLPLPRDSGVSQTFRSGTQAQLARGIEAAWAKAHAHSAEDVTTALDGDDRVTRIRTPLGANLCLNWRDVDRTNPGKGKAMFTFVCNR